MVKTDNVKIIDSVIEVLRANNNAMKIIALFQALDKNAQTILLNLAMQKVCLGYPEKIEYDAYNCSVSLKD